MQVVTIKQEDLQIAEEQEAVVVVKDLTVEETEEEKIN
jgi:hypothetical protein